MNKTVMSLCVAGTLTAGAGWSALGADTVVTSDDRQSITHQKAGHSTKAWRASKLIGANVQDRAGETLGQLQDIVLDPATGQANFAVISLNLPGHQGHMTAIPWSLVQNTSEPNRVVVTVDQNRITSAPMFSSAQWPDFETTYNQRVYSYYNLDYQRPAMGGRIPLSDTEQGSSYRRGKENNFPRPQPDGRETFSELDERNKTEQ